MLRVFLALSFLLVPVHVFAQDVTEKKKTDSEESVYSYRKVHDPNGIGKFYMGREIAHVMGYGLNGRGAMWLERPTREQEEKLSQLIELLGLKPGMTVVDLGAGSGRITFMMAPKVAPDGKIMAVDVQEEMLAVIEKKIDNTGVKNVVPVKGKVATTGLEANSVDLIVMVDVYHELEFPHEMLADFKKILAPGGRIAWVEYRKEDPRVPIKLVHKMTEKQVKKEASQKEFGFEFVETIEKLPQQHIIIFKKPEEKKSPPEKKP